MFQEKCFSYPLMHMPRELGRQASSTYRLFTEPMNNTLQYQAKQIAAVR